MSGVRKYLFKQTAREKLPRLARTLTDSYQVQALEPDIEIVLMTGRVRNPAEAARLMQRYQASTGPELVRSLPPPPGPNWRRRLKRWIRQLEGSYQSDPHQREFYAFMPQMADED